MTTDKKPSLLYFSNTRLGSLHIYILTVTPINYTVNSITLFGKALNVTSTLLSLVC